MCGDRKRDLRYYRCTELEKGKKKKESRQVKEYMKGINQSNKNPQHCEK
jgi:hypothetical protein